MNESILITEASYDDAEGIAQVHIRSWQTTYVDIVDKDFLSALRFEDKLTKWQNILKSKNQAIIYVAKFNDEIVGFIHGGRNRNPYNLYDSELYAIYILDIYQNKGIGKKLLSAFFKWLVSNQFYSLIVWIAEDNQNKKFYINLGAKLTPLSSILKIANKEIKLVAYAWHLVF